MAKASISFVKGKGSTTHNNRDFFAENVIKDKTPDNITYKKESLTEAYEKCFAKEIEIYNSTQKRMDRKIKGIGGYMDQLKNSGNGEQVFYENVVQIGNMQDCHVDSDQGQVAKKILDDYMRDFQVRNPNLYVFNAVLHLDEQTPHLHIDYIPLATGYKQGLKLRNSLDRALKQQGLDGQSNKYDHSTKAWQNREKDHIEQIMNKHGLERAEDKGLKAEHKSVEYYKTVVNNINNEIKALPSEIEHKPTVLGKKGKATVLIRDLEQLERRAKLSSIHENTVKSLISDVSKIKQSTHDYSTETNHMISIALKQAEDERLKASKELKQAEEIKANYSRMYEQQKELNDKFIKLYNMYNSQKEKINELNNNNTNLKAKIDVLSNLNEKRVHEVAEPLKTQIKGLETHLKASLDSIVDIAIAINMLKHDDYEDYKVELTEKQSNLIDGLIEYSKASINQCIEVFKDDTVNVMERKIDKEMSISDALESFVEPVFEPHQRSRSQGISR